MRIRSILFPAFVFILIAACSKKSDPNPQVQTTQPPTSTQSVCLIETAYLANGDEQRYSFNDAGAIDTITFVHKTFLSNLIMSYDMSGHLAKITNSPSEYVWNITFVTGANGRPSKAIYISPTTHDTAFYFYNSDRSIEHMIDRFKTVFRYLYDDAGNVTKIYKNGGTGEYLYREFTYDAEKYGLHDVPFTSFTLDYTLDDIVAYCDYDPVVPIHNAQSITYYNSSGNVVAVSYVNTYNSWGYPLSTASAGSDVGETFAYSCK